MDSATRTMVGRLDRAPTVASRPRLAWLGRMLAMVVLVTGAACDRTPVAPAGAPGGAASTGEGGAGGAPSSVGVGPPIKVFELLDDMESGRDGLVTPIGLASWYVSPADPAQAQPAIWDLADHSASRGTSLAAQHVLVGPSGSADVHIQFHGPGFFSGGSPFPDVSGYTAVAFWARATDGTPVVVALEDDVVTSGDRAYTTSRASTKPWFEAPVSVTAEWRRHILLFDDFRQPNQPDARVDTKALWSVHFIAGLGGAGAEVWFDDLALLCRGTCPKPAYDVPVTPGPGMDESTLSWQIGTGPDPDLTCAEVAPLEMAPLADVRADPVEKLILRVRIPSEPTATAPAWDWLIEDVASGARLDVLSLDDQSTTVAIPITAAASYKVVTHMHGPGIQVCGAGLVVTAH